MKIGNIEVHGIIYRITNLINNNDMNYIETILGMNEISKKYKYSTTSIKNHLNHKPNKIKNHIFIYKEEYNKISR